MFVAGGRIPKRDLEHVIRNVLREFQVSMQPLSDPLWGGYGRIVLRE